MLSMKMYAQF